MVFINGEREREETATLILHYTRDERTIAVRAWRRGARCRAVVASGRAASSWARRGDSGAGGVERGGCAARRPIFLAAARWERSRKERGKREREREVEWDRVVRERKGEGRSAGGGNGCQGGRRRATGSIGP
jgi:hypothetical protein